MNFDERVADMIDDMSVFDDWSERYEYIISLGKKLDPLPAPYQTEEHLIKGCQSRVWVGCEVEDGKMTIMAESDSLITKGLIAIFVKLLSGLSPQEILDADMSKLDECGLKEHLASTRANALNSMADTIKKAAAQLN